MYVSPTKFIGQKATCRSISNILKKLTILLLHLLNSFQRLTSEIPENVQVEKTLLSKVVFQGLL
jgi:hypothetical protein